MSTPPKKSLFAIIISIVVTAGAAITGGVLYTQTITNEGNVAPIITIQPINQNNVYINQTVFVNASISDPDGTINSIIWSQKAGPKSTYEQIAEDLYFTPRANGSYLFELEVQDNEQAITETGFLINVGAPVVIPPPPTCLPNEHLENGVCVPNTPPPPPTCKPTEHLENGVCVPNPPPPPPPVGNDTIKVILTGDIASGTAGTAVFNQIKAQNPTNVIVLGDLGYASDLKWFKSTYGTLGNKLNCLVGNHDSPEDGSSSIYTETKNYCGSAYYFKKNNVLFMGFDTNGDLTTQATSAGKLLTNTDFMNGIKSVHIMSHKPCAVPPNAHHPVESNVKAFCDSVKSKIPTGVKQYYDQAHNHVMSASADGTYKQVGAGGRSHYTCGTSTAFPFCDNVHFGFLEYIIKPDGTTTSSFIDSTGDIVK